MPRSHRFGGTVGEDVPHRHQDVSELEELLACGWQIERPVLVRPAWAHDRSNSVDYHVILTNDRRRSLVVLVDSAEVRQFMARYALTA